MIKISDYSFEGPYGSTDDLKDRSGVYAILTKVGANYNVLDIGESATVKTRLETHDRKDCWKKHNQGSIMFAVYYTPDKQQSGRMLIE